jgi:DNA-nicking Smr family endonuclease
VLTNGSTADLHGLHVDEALIILENLLSKVTGQLKYFYIITGTGHHSYEGKSRLLPAIIRFLDEFGCTWVDHSTDKRGGLLKVTLPQ